MENILQADFEQTVDDEEDNILEEDINTSSSQTYWFLTPKCGWYSPQKGMEALHNLTDSDVEYCESDPYDKFMRRHLQHYGYYTGRNATFRDNFQSLQEWRRNYDVRLSGQHSLSLMEEQLGKNGGSLQNRMLDGPFFSGEGQLPDDLLHRTTQLVFQYQAGRKIPKLREPRNLYALTKEAGPQQATRWPSHMQVVCPAIRFIEAISPNPEPLYKATGKEPTPSVRGPQIGEMIYYNDPGRDLYFMRSRVAGCRLAMRSMTLTPREFPEDNLTLEFESRFESGNLLKVDKITDFEYELTLRTDLYTSKHTQWYFFRVRNMRPERTYRFTIVNLMKPSSLYNQGMKPVFYSEANAKKNKIGWTRFGTNIRYYRNNLCSRDGRCFYSLTWQCEFPYKEDTCYFAHCYPYTYTDLQEYLLLLANDPVRSRFCKQRVLCRTLAGNLVYILTITSPSRNPEISRAKRAVVLSARVHPGETNASWMMKGFLDYLTGSSADAKLLRDTFIFKIVPMLNPDGVIVGNYRCSLAGRDLNRNYKSVLKDSFPSIWHTKMMVKRLRAEREVVLYCDLHGHSRKNNIFIYGCENKHNPQRRFKERIFPLMLSKNAHQSFAFDSCKYKVQKSKEGTGRIVMFYLGIMNSYTLEATFGGTSLPGARKDTHLGPHDLELIGYHFCDTLLDYCDPDLSKAEACMCELQERMRRQIMRKLRLQGSEDINIDDYYSDMESDTSGSDSSCDDGLPVHLLAIAPKLQRKKKMRSRRERSRAIPVKSVVPSSTESTKVTSHSAKMPTGDKIKAIRYAQNSGGRKKDDQSASARPAAHSASAFADDRSQQTNDRSAKKLATVSLKYVDPLLGIFVTRTGFIGKRSDYLEVLTSAYIRSGVLMVPDANKDYPLRYSNGAKAPEGNFSVQYLANHLGMMSESDESKSSSPLMRNASCQWSPQPKSSGTDSDDGDDVTKEAILAEEQYEILRQSALKRQLSAGQQRLLAQKHLVAVAAMQQRRESGGKQRLSSATSERARSAIKQHPNPFEDQSESSAPEFSLLTSSHDKTTRVITRTSSASNLISHKRSQESSGGSISASFGTKGLPHTARDPPRSENDPGELLSQAGGGGPLAGVGNSKFKKQSAFVLPPETSIAVEAPPVDGALEEDKSASSLLQEQQEEEENEQERHAHRKRTALSFGSPRTQQQQQQLVFTKRNSSEESSKSPPKPPAEEEDASPRGFANSDHSKKIWSNEPRPERSFPGKPPNLKPFQSGIEAALAQDDSARRRPAAPGGSLTRRQHAPEIPSDLSEVRRISEHHESSSEHSIALPKRPTSLNQSEMKGFIQGELAFPKSSDVSVIPSGVKKNNAVIMETDTDNLAVKSNRYYVKPKPAESVEEIHSNYYKAKNHRTTDDSFFGMSDRIGLSMAPKSGTRVPPVVANIAELRRSLMGQGRDSVDHHPHPKHQQFKKPSEETSHHHDDGIPFSQRPRRRNPAGLAGRQRARPLADADDPLSRHNSTVRHQQHDVTESLRRDSQRRLETVFDDDELFSDDDVDNASTTATFSGKKQQQRRRRNHGPSRKSPADLLHAEAGRDCVIGDDGIGMSDDVIVRRADSGATAYTQGNATIEKHADSSMTNIRIGSRTTGRNSQVAEHWTDSHYRQSGGGGGNGNSSTLGNPVTSVTSGSSTTPTLSNVSLNMKGDNNDDRTYVTTPAMASRPVPPLLRYLSAKQVHNKKK